MYTPTISHTDDDITEQSSMSVVTGQCCVLVNTYLAGNWSIYEGEKPCSIDYALCRAYYFSRQLSKLASFPGQYLITYSTVRKYSEGRPGRSGHVREGLGDQVMRGKAWEIRSCEGRPGKIRSCEGRPGRSGHAREGLGDQVMQGKAWEDQVM